MTDETPKPLSASARIVSYNILSSELADPEYFTKCKPEHLHKSNRLPKILLKLQEEIDSSPDDTPAVFCLQEVSHAWATSLHVFFAERGYHMVTGLYGGKFNGYMGIATAYPTKSFETLKIDLVRLSEKKKGGWPRKPRDPEPTVLRKYVYDPIANPMKAAYRYYRPKKREQDAWQYSQWRYNQFIAVKLKNREEGSTPFWLGNYHMPCAFRTPAVMNIHSDLVGCRIQNLSRGNADEDPVPFVLAGDFNILPESPHYSLLRTGVLDEKDETYPDEKFSMNWKPGFKGMRSAYFEMNGEEPEFTNNAHNGAMNAESFIGTLDYIFLSDEWKVKAVKETPKKEGLEGVYPDEQEPSDHVVIAASLEL
jgi:mRNA deadenylase 3'-5' endonuclease subunit Ccr4